VIPGILGLFPFLSVVCPGAAVAAPGDSRPRIGLVLGGGAARGLAHVGVLRWLEEHRVPVDLVAGTSMGGLLGGVYATGMSSEEIAALVRDLDWDLILRPDVPYPRKSIRRKEDARDYPVKIELGLRGGLQLPGGLSSGHQIGLVLSRIALPYSDVARFDDMPTPFRCVATDMEKGETVVLAQGPLEVALRATMAFPGVFDPVRADGRLLADGGVLNNLPVDVARSMGADVVVAVQVSAARFTKVSPNLAGLMGRALDLMGEELDAPRLRQADVVLVPDLEGVLATNFGKSDAIAERGYAAAAAQEAALLPYALDEGAWAEHRARREARRRAAVRTPSFVEVGGVGEAAAAEIAERLRPHVGRPVDPAKLGSDLDAIVGTGRYASALYGVVRRGDALGLAVHVAGKAHGPPFVGFSLDINNEREDVTLGVGSRITFMDLTGIGSELRLDLAVGSTLGVSAELLQPLGPQGPVRRRGAFVTPRAFYEQRSENLYDGDALVAVYGRERAGGGADLALLGTSRLQFRAGYEAAHVRNVARVGDPLLPESRGWEQLAQARLEYDGHDRAFFPRGGARFESRAAWYLEAPGAARDFGQAAARLGIAWPMGGQGQAALRLSGGASSGDPPVPYQFTLGGPFQLGAFGTAAFRGPHFLLGQLGYQRSLARLPALVGDRLYLAALVEAGSAFDRIADAALKVSVSAGLAADTLLGPCFVGVSAGNGDVRFTVSVGRLVR
jgi:NTE family protein